MPLQTNTPLAVAGPKIELPQQQTATEKLRLSRRNAVLDAIDRLQQRTGATQFTRRDIVAEVQTTTTGFERQTI